MQSVPIWIAAADASTAGTEPSTCATALRAENLGSHFTQPAREPARGYLGYAKAAAGAVLDATAQPPMVQLRIKFEVEFEGQLRGQFLHGVVGSDQTAAVKGRCRDFAGLFARRQSGVRAAPSGRHLARRREADARRGRDILGGHAFERLAAAAPRGRSDAMQHFDRRYDA